MAIDICFIDFSILPSVILRQYLFDNITKQYPIYLCKLNDSQETRIKKLAVAKASMHGSH